MYRSEQAKTYAAGCQCDGERALIGKPAESVKWAGSTRAAVGGEGAKSPHPPCFLRPSSQVNEKMKIIS